MQLTSGYQTQDLLHKRQFLSQLDYNSTSTNVSELEHKLLFLQVYKYIACTVQKNSKLFYNVHNPTFAKATLGTYYEMPYKIQLSLMKATWLEFPWLQQCTFLTNLQRIEQQKSEQRG